MLSLEDFCVYYAAKCDKCQGERRVLQDSTWYACSCQILATAKWKLDQIRIHPPELKTKTWDDFTGIIQANSEQIGSLSVNSVIDAKEKALAYCYQDGKVSPENLILHKRASKGHNVIIAGERQSGKTLLGILIIKEVLRTSIVHNVPLSFEWISSSEIKEAARWDNVKPLDHIKLDALAEVDFLIIDDMDIEIEAQGKSYNKTSPPDRTSLNILFGQRDMYGHPTIILCSQRLLKFAESPMHTDNIIQQWGAEFFHIFTNQNNTIISLSREK